MEDTRIVSLYWERNEQAIAESSAKYGRYCHSIAHNILMDDSDAEECVNDTWLRAWNAMPPHRPSVLQTFFGKITRNLSFDRYRRLHRQKRGGGQIELALEELGEIVSGKDDPHFMLIKKELAEEINRFLASLPEEKRMMFVLRYWYAESVSEIAKSCGKSVNNVSVTLSRIRAKLKEHLTERGYDL
ncbi:MAG TPA: RNA polymerase subunit sigma-70 [Lachnospiraceae bacterium]|nr:RNA polymerase subunit sigma-70 [Lachnospiraceae bacterium]